jgi:hypothetical protein
MACSNASSSDSLDRSMEILWYSSPGFGTPEKEKVKNCTQDMIEKEEHSK